MPEKLTTDIFTKRATEIHSGKYDYSETTYTKITAPVNINCYQHGVFQIKASEHLRGIGCTSCEFKSSGTKNRLNTTRFIEKANTIHGDRYLYKSTKFCGYKSKVIITCKKHGDFTQIAGGHLNGQGCPLCSLEGRVNRVEGLAAFIVKSKIIHGLTYEYNNCYYTGTNRKLLITCQHHGDFSQTPSKHLSGQGCPLCADKRGGQRNRSTTSEFILKADKIHNFVYDYSLVNYITCNTPVTIICKLHGTFEQSPSKHLVGHSCHTCAQTGYNSKKSGILYILKCGDITKIGITNKESDNRASSVSRSYGAEFRVVKEYKFVDGSLPDRLETLLLRSLRKQYTQPSHKFEGYSECFYNVILSKLFTEVETLIGEISGN